MKANLLFFFISICCFHIEIPAFSETVHAGVHEIDQKTTPPYAKWGQLALKETKAKYPRADIIDYLHVGRVENTKYTTETFKLWLKQGDREFGVLINIEFDPKTDGIRKISFRETSR